MIFPIFESCLKEKKNITFIMNNDNYYYQKSNIYDIYEDKTGNKKL